MEQAIKDAIERLAKKALEPERAGDAMQLTQAALNLAHVLALLDGVKRKE